MMGSKKVPHDGKTLNMNSKILLTYTLDRVFIDSAIKYFGCR